MSEFIVWAVYVVGLIGLSWGVGWFYSDAFSLRANARDRSLFWLFLVLDALWMLLFLTVLIPAVTP